MDFTPVGATVNTPDTDTEPPSPSDPKSGFSRTFSFTKGSFKRCYLVAPPPPPPPIVVPAAVGYKECLKNHAAGIGGHALDGCGEFMLSPNFYPSDPTSLKCAACGCHRNFHRRYNHHRPKHVLNHPQNRLLLPPPPAHNNPHSLSPSPSPSRSPSPSPGPTLSPQSPPPVSHLPPSYFASPTQMLLALSSAVSGPSNEINHHRQINERAPAVSYQPSEKKRSRTKFSQEQKAKMCLFAEKVGWKMQRSEEKLVEEFCNEIGVGRSRFKIWMHNNKHSRKKRSVDRSDGGAGGGGQMTHSNVDEISNGEGGGRLGFGSRDANHNTNRSSFDLVNNGSSSSS